MPKIVDKAQKRFDIATKSISIFCDKGFDNLTVNEVAKNANIAKGTIYEYFDSKEDIVFAILEYSQKDYDKDVLTNIKNSTNIEEKILALFGLCLLNDKINIQRRKIYKEFVKICLKNPSKGMVLFLKNVRQRYLNWLTDIFKEGIRQGHFNETILEFTDMLITCGENIVIFNQIDNYHKKDELKTQIKTVLKLTTKENNR